MKFAILIPFFLQMFIINIDEFYFHVRRNLPKWERIGHPLDTLSVLVCFLFVRFFTYSPFLLKIYIFLSIFSCIFVTKDEFVHKECCPASEQWLHAFLFLNHPVLLTVTGLLWAMPEWFKDYAPEMGAEPVFTFQILCTTLFFLYQTIYWNFICKDKSITPSTKN